MEEKKVEKKAPPVKRKKGKKYELLCSVKIGGVLKKKGSKVELTEKGYKHFRKLKYVK